MEQFKTQHTDEGKRENESLSKATDVPSGQEDYVVKSVSSEERYQNPIHLVGNRPPWTGLVNRQQTTVNNPTANSNKPQKKDHHLELLQYIILTVQF